MKQTTEKHLSNRYNSPRGPPSHNLFIIICGAVFLRGQKFCPKFVINPDLKKCTEIEVREPVARPKRQSGRKGRTDAYPKNGVTDNLIILRDLQMNFVNVFLFYSLLRLIRLIPKFSSLLPSNRHMYQTPNRLEHAEIHSCNQNV